MRFRAALFLLVGGCATMRVDRMFWAYRDGPGCVVAAERDGEVVLAQAYGHADLDQGTELTVDSVFHVASLSKQFTAFAIVLLEHAGKLSLDDDIRKWIPELPDFGKRITLRHLLWHTSGLRDQWDLLDLAGWRTEEDVITTADILDLLTHQKELNFNPGDEFYYSNTNYTLLGVIVERASGRSLRQFTTDEIFRPLGMTHTFFHDDHSEVVAGRAVAYEKRGAAWHRFVPGYDTVGATSLFTTAPDLAKWADNFDHPVVGDASILAEMIEPGRLNDGEVLHYAKGLGVGSYRGQRLIEHGGNDSGYYASFMRFPAQRFGVACLCSMGENRAVAYAYGVADIYLKDVLAPRPPPSPAPAETNDFYFHTVRDEVWHRPGPGFVRVDPPQNVDLARYTGTYHSPELDVNVQVVQRGPQLFLRRRKHADAPMDAFMPDGFLADRFVVHFTEGGMTLTTGRVRRLKFSRSDR